MTKDIAIKSTQLPAKPPRIGLALGGGGARGLGHILMLEAFEELGLRPSAIAGTSIGAIYGACYASGLTAHQIRVYTEEVLNQRFDLARQLFQSRAAPVPQLMNLFRLKTALLNGEALLDLVLPTRVARDFATLEIPLRICATDFHRQECVVFTDGPLRRAVAASMALPVLFAPVAHDGMALMDGGLVNPLPFDVFGPDVDITVAIDVSGIPRTPDEHAAPTAIEALVGSSQILQRAIVKEKLRSRQPDVYVDVAVEQFHVLEFHRYPEILEAAQPAKALLKERLRKILGATLAETEPVAEPDKPKRLPKPPRKLTGPREDA